MVNIIGLIAAMAQESNALLRKITPWERTSFGRLSAYAFSVFTRSCVLVTSGMGALRAKEAAFRLIQEHKPHVLISFGIAGAVEPDMEIGDVVLAKAYCQADQGVLSQVLPLAAWPEPDRNAVSQAMIRLGKRVFVGTAVTTTGSQFTLKQLEGMDHPVLEMETAGIAPLAAESGIPLYSLRSISDGPRAPIPIDLAEVMDENANLKTGELIKAVIRNPGIIFQGSRMLRNTSTAAENAAIAILETLQHWSD